jgi:hypothetical protein
VENIKKVLTKTTIVGLKKTYKDITAKPIKLQTKRNYGNKAWLVERKSMKFIRY